MAMRVLLLIACASFVAAPDAPRARTTDDLSISAGRLVQPDACAAAGRPVSSTAYRSLFANHVSKGSCIAGTGCCFCSRRGSRALSDDSKCVSITSAKNLGYQILKGSNVERTSAATTDSIGMFKCHCQQNAIESAGSVGLGGVLDASFHLPADGVAREGEFLALFDPEDRLVSLPVGSASLRAGMRHGVAQVALKRGPEIKRMEGDLNRLKDGYHLTFKICSGPADEEGHCPAQTEPHDGVCCRPAHRIQRQAEATAKLETQPPVTVRVVKCLEVDIVAFRNMMLDFLHLGNAALAEATAEKAMSVLAGPNYCAAQQGGRCPERNVDKPEIKGRKNIFQLGELLMLFLERCPVDQAELDAVAERGTARVPERFSSPGMQIMDIMSKLAAKLPEEAKGPARTDLATAKASNFLQLVATSTSKQLARVHMAWSWGKLFKFAVGLSCAIATVATAGAAAPICIGVVVAANLVTDAATGELSKKGVAKCLFNAACSTVDIVAPGVGSAINIGATVAETSFTEYDRQKAGLFKEDCKGISKSLGQATCPQYHFKVVPEPFQEAIKIGGVAAFFAGGSSVKVRLYRIETSWTTNIGGQVESFKSVTKYPFSYIYQAMRKFGELGGACSKMWDDFPGKFVFYSMLPWSQSASSDDTAIDRAKLIQKALYSITNGECGAVMRSKERVFSHGHNQLNSCPSVLDDDDSYDEDHSTDNTVFFTLYSYFGSVNWLLHTIARNHHDRHKDFHFAPTLFNKKTDDFLKWEHKFIRDGDFIDVKSQKIPYTSKAKVSRDGRVAVVESSNAASCDSPPCYKISTMRKPTWFTNCPQSGGRPISATKIPTGLTAGVYNYHGFCDSAETCDSNGRSSRKETIMGTKPSKGRIVIISDSAGNKFYFKNPRADFSMTNIAINALGIAAMSLDVAEGMGAIPKKGLAKHITKDLFSTVGQAVIQLSDNKDGASLAGISELLASKEDSNHESPLVSNCLQCCTHQMHTEGISVDGEACAANTMFGEACQCVALKQSCFGVDQGMESSTSALSLPRTDPAQTACADAFKQLTRAVVGVDGLIVPKHSSLRGLLYKPVQDGGCGVVSPHDLRYL